MAADEHPIDLTDLPLQPTGSGVADTEIARMAAELADGDASVGAGEERDAAVDRVGRDGDGVPTRTQA